MRDRVAGDLAATGLVLAWDQSSHEETGFDQLYTVAPSAMPQIAAVFAACEYFLEMLTCVDLRQTESRMRLVYTFNCFGPHDRHRVSADLAPTRPWTGPPPKKPKRAPPAADGVVENAAAPTESIGVSIVSVFAAADWYEREVHEMFGVEFSGHPKLKRLLLPDDADFFPLLRDFGRIEDAP